MSFVLIILVETALFQGLQYFSILPVFHYLQAALLIKT